MGSFSKIKKLLEEKDKFLLIGHVSPDGDSLGALLSFNEILKKLNKITRIVCKDSISTCFSFLDDVCEIKNDFLLGNFDAVILLDNGDLKRTGFYSRLKKIDTKKFPILNIDHHLKNDIWKIATINYVNENASSVCELIYDLFIGLNIEISPKVATALLCGIYSDTGGFQHPNTSQKVFEIVSDLLNTGAKLKKISENISSSKSISTLKLWGIALGRLKTSKKWEITYSIITQKDICTAGATEEEVAGLVNLINCIPSSKIALLLYETKNGSVKGSLRTDKDGVDVSKIAALFGGGGHKKAAGFSIEGKIVEKNGVWEIISDSPTSELI